MQFDLFSGVRCVHKIPKCNYVLALSCACPSTHQSFWNNSAPTRQIFTKFDMRIFQKSVAKTQVLLKSDKNTG